MGWIFLAVDDEVFWISTSDLAQVTSDRDRPLFSTFISPVTQIALLLFLNLWVVELLLKLEGCWVFWLPETTVPRLIHTPREHKLNLRHISEVVSLVFYDANNMSLSALAKSKPIFSSSIQSFIFLHIHIQLDQVTIFEILFTQSVWNFNSTQESKRTLCKVKVVSNEVNCFEHSQILLTPLTDDHRVLQSNFSALLLDLVNQKPFLYDTGMELLHHVSNKLVIKVYLTLDLLYVDWLQEVTALTISFVSWLNVIAQNVTLLWHIDVFETSVLLSISTVI